MHICTLKYLMNVQPKDLQRKDGQRQLLYYVGLIRACNKVLYQMVYIGKKVCIPLRIFVMAIGVVEFSREGYKIRKVFA